MLPNLYIEFTFFFSTVTSVASKTEPFLLEGSLAFSLKGEIQELPFSTLLQGRNRHAYSY